MAEDPKRAASPTEEVTSYFPISLTDLDLSNVVGGVSVAQSTANQVQFNLMKQPSHIHETIMCCW